MSKNVLIGIPCLLTGGTEMQTLHLVKALCEGGYHCVTVCYFEYDYTVVQQFEQTGSRVVCLSAYGRRPDGIRSTYRFLKSGLKRVIEEYRPKIAHIQYMAPGALPIFILRKLGIKRIIATLHTDASQYRSLMMVHMAQRHLTKAFTCVSQNAESGFFGKSSLFTEEMPLGRHNHFTIPNCLPAKFEFNKDATDICIREYTIGVVSGLKEIKGMDMVMPAFAKVLSSNGQARMIIVGDGPCREMMEQQMREYNISADSVTWAGKQSHRAALESMKKMQLVWVPSRGEGFGLTALEAMANGCVVVASDIGGLKDLVRNDDNGILIPVGDTDSLAKKSIELLAAGERMETMSRKAIENAKQYTYHKYKETILAMYGKI